MEENNKLPKLIMIIPCFNEEHVLPKTSGSFIQKLNYLIHEQIVSQNSFILLIDDGSTDDTWTYIVSLTKENERVSAVKLSRNRGHQNALFAGFLEARGKCDICVSIDCDGQDDIDAIDSMIDCYNLGFEVVYGVRSDRESDSWFKKNTAQTFYKIMNALGAETVYNHADYRLLSNRVLDELSGYTEINLFLRGMIPLIGFKSTSVYYVRQKRMAGNSKYPLVKMVSFAINGITSMSVTPLRIITISGIAGGLLSIAGVFWSIIQYALGNAVSGWTSIISILSLLGSIQVLGIGIIGEYVGKIYLEVKHRPRFIIEKKIEHFD